MLVENKYRATELVEVIPEGVVKETQYRAGARVEGNPFLKKTKVPAVDDGNLAGSWEGGTKGISRAKFQSQKLVKRSRIPSGNAR